MSDFNLETVIEDAITDASIAPEPVEAAEAAEVSTDISADTAPDTSDGADPSIEAASAEAASIEVASPGARQPAQAKPEEAVDKKLGIAPFTNGRENRIPYSRVKKIVANAEKEALKPLTEKLSQLEPKVQQYEAQLQKVAEFEEVMLNDSQRFLQMLSTIPAYQQFFSYVNQLQEQVQKGAQATEQVVDQDPMPGPDEVQPDGSAIYSEQGLRALMDWQARQVEAKIAARYKPIEAEWQRQEHLAKVIPQVEAQIKEARQWPLFNENEDAITQALASNPAMSLEAAYRQVVFPKLQVNRDQMRTQILSELKQAPRATAAPAQSHRAAPAPKGPQSLEDIIAASIQNIPNR